MGKQTNKIEYVDQVQFDKNLDESLEILINDGANDDDINFYIDDYKSRYAVKKKDGTKPNSTSTSASQKQDLVQKNGSSGTPQFRLANDKDFEKGQSKGKFVSNKNIPKTETKEEIYDLKPNSSTPVVKEKEVLGQESDYVLDQKGDRPIPFDNQTKSLTEEQKSSIGFSVEQKQEALKDKEKSNEINTDSFKEDLYNFTEKDKEEIKSDIDKEIYSENLDSESPFKFYSTYNQEPKFNPATQTFEQYEKDGFVDKEFNDKKLKKIGVDPADFDGYLNEKGFKKDFVEKEEKGLFEGNGKNLSGASIQLAREIQKQRLLTNYLSERNQRNYKLKTLQAKKENLERSGENAIKVQKETLFEPTEVESYLENEFPILSKKLKERDEESRKILEEHNNGDAEIWYGTKNTLKSGWNGFLDRINNLSATVYDKIGMDETAEGIRMAHEESQILKPDTRDVSYVSGKTIDYNGVKYLVDDSGQIYDKDKKIRVTDLFFKPTYDEIISMSEKGEKDWIFSPQGASMQLSGVLGDMVVQLALTKGFGNVLISPGANQLLNLSKLAKVPLSRGLSSSIIAQSTLGYSQGLEETLKSAKEAGLNDEESKMLANDAAQRMAKLYALTSPISPQTKAVESLFGSAEKELIKSAIASYKQLGKKGFLETLTKGLNKLSKKSVGFLEEGGKELIQENIQQSGEILGVNKQTNIAAGKEIVKDTISFDDFMNTSILSLMSGGLISQMKMPKLFKNGDLDQLRTLNTLSQDYNKFDENLKDLVNSGSVDSEYADMLRKDVKVFSNNKNKIPQDTKPDIALDLMRKLDEISTLENKKKTLDNSFHSGIDEEIKLKREEIKSIYEKSKTAKTLDEESVVEQSEAQPQAEVQETEQEAITKEDIEVRRKETESKIKRKELFSDGGTFSNILGESGVDSVPTRHTETNGIEFVEFSNPNTGIVDVVMSGTSSNDFVGYYRIYENGKPTEKWSSKFENQSRNKENFKTMIGGVQSMLPKGHLYTEKTSISTDGLRVWEQQLNRGYEVQRDSNGNIVTNEVAINGDAINNELGIDVELGSFSDIEITKQQFESVKEKLLPYLKKLGLDSDNIRIQEKTIERTGRKYNTVVIDLPVLKSKTSESNNNQINNADNYLGTPTVTQTEDGDLYEFKTKDGIIAGVMVSPTEFRIDGISANEIGKGMGSKMFENLIDHLKNKGVDTITTKSAGEGAVKMHQKAVDKGLLTEVSKNGREATFNINKNESTPTENNVSQEVDVNSPNPNQINNDKKLYSEEEVDAYELKYDQEYNEITDKLDKELKKKGITSFEERQSEYKKNKEIIFNNSERTKLRKHNNEILNNSFKRAINNIEIKNNFLTEGKKEYVKEKIVKTLSKRFGIDNSGFDMSSKLKGFLEGKEFEGIKQDIINAFLPVGTRFNDLTSDEKTEALSKTNEIVKSFTKNITNEIVNNTKNESTQGENNVSDGNSRTGIEPLAEVGKTTEQATENAPTKSISPTVDSKPIEGENEVEYALNEINKGILEWSGNILSPRIDLGISWADIRKGEADIKRGKPSTVPAKRLIEAINKAKKEGGYRYKQGTGGPSMRSAQFVSFEDMQKATNEEGLTDAEINEINQKEDDLSNQYDEYFNSLDEESQNEILENYENKPREISENSEIGKSENDVSNEQKEEGAREEKVKEDSVLDRILNQDELKDTFDFLDSLKIDPKDLKATLPFLPNVWNTFIDGVKLSMKAGNTMRKAIIEAKNVLESQGFDKLEINKVLVAFQDKFLTEEEKAFIDGVLNDSSSEENSRKFSDMASKFPNTEEVGLYMSGDTYEKYMGVRPENNQEMFRMRLIDALKYGIDTIEVAVETFGDNFVDKVLDYIESNNISIESKSLLLISLENELERQKIADPTNKDIQAKLNLVLAKRQAFASSVSKALNMNRLKAFAKAGFDKTEITDKMFSDTEKRAKRKVENAIESTFEDINNEDSSDEFDSDFVIAEPKNKRSKEDAKKDLNDALKALKEDWKNLNKGITLNATIPGYKQIEVATPHILKMAKAMVEIGGYNTKEIIETIYDNLKGTFNGVKKSDISNILKEDQTKSKPKKNQKMKDLVKEALINRGFFREVNVKQKDGTREVKKYLDWKKLAGKEGTLENIKKKTEEALKDLGYTDSQIEKMQDALIEELTDLRASIIEKSMNELDNRNRIKDNTERKNIAKKLSELYNFGLFEKAPDAYQNLLNSAIGFNKFKEKQFEELTKLAESLSILFSFENGKNNNNKLSQLAIKTQASIINQEVKAILNFAAFADGNKAYKLTYILREFAGLSQRAKLLSLKQFIENPFSGFVERKFQQVGEFFITKEDGRLVANRKKLSKHILNDIIQNGGSSYGDVTTVLTSETAIEGWLNKQSDNRLYHLMLTNLTGRSYLEAADSMNKALLTEKMFTQNLVKVLSSKGSPLGIMSKSEAMKYVADKITGQNFEDALKLAEEVIDKVNNESGKNILPKTKQNIYRFANDIVKESLSQGTKMDLELVEKSYNSAYKSAGFNLGHEANNVISRLVGAANSSTGIRLDRAIKQKKWNLAAIYNLESILVRNILNPFVGGGTNWVVLTAQKAGMDPISIFSDLANARDNKIDLTTEEGMKNLENALVRSTNLRNTSTRTLIGAVVSISMAAAYIASGKGDDLEDWLKKNEWSRKYFKVLSPTVIALMMSIENDEFSEFSADMASIKSDNFNQTLNLIKSFDNEKRSTLGELGRWTAQPFDTPLPWRFVKDVDNLQKGIRGIPEYKSDYRVTGFLNGFFQGGSFDYMGIRPDGDPKFDKKKKKKKSQIRF